MSEQAAFERLATPHAKSHEPPARKALAGLVWQRLIGIGLFVSLVMVALLLVRSPTSPVLLHDDVVLLGEISGDETSNTSGQASTLEHLFQAPSGVGEGNVRWALFLPYVETSFVLYVNGQPWLTELPKDAAPVSHRGAVLVDLQGAQWGAGDNWIGLRSAPSAEWAQQVPIYLGPYDTLFPIWSERQAISTGILSQLHTVMMWLSSAMGILYALRRGEVLFGWVALGIFFTACYNFDRLMPVPPLGAEKWGMLMTMTIVVGILCLIMSSSLFFGLRQKRMERTLLGIGLAGGLLVGLPTAVGEWIWGIAFPAWLIVAVAIGVAALAVLVRRCLDRQRRQDAAIILFVGVTLLGFWGHDQAIARDLLPASRGDLLNFGLFALVVSQAWFVLTKFAGALNRLENLTASLDRRVKQREAELAALLEQRVKDAEARALTKERNRLMQDMHDGVGGRLVSALSLLETDRISLDDVREEIRNCLEDIRLTIESLDIDAGDLPTLLGSFRYQVEPRLVRHRISLRWNVDDLPTGQGFNPVHNLHLLRILQEAVSNILRHAGADEIHFDLRMTSDVLCLTIGDNGCGLPDMDRRRSGRGLGNMRSRISVMGGKIAFRNSGLGTEVEIKMSADLLKQVPMGAFTDLVISHA